MTREELLPLELMRSIPALYYNEGTPIADTVIHAKYFLAAFTWLVAECEVQGDDVMFYGYVVNTADPRMSEWGYFMLSQLMEIKIDSGLGVERDLYFQVCSFSEYMKGEGSVYA